MLCNHRTLLLRGILNRKLSSVVERNPDVAVIPTETIGPAPSHFRIAADPLVVKHDRKHMAATVACLPEAWEKIDLVNPYERDWNRVEHRNHRPWMTPLISTRKAFRLEQDSLVYNALPYYQYATKTHCRQDKLEDLMHSLNSFNLRRGNEIRYSNDFAPLTDELITALCHDWKPTVSRFGEVDRSTLTSLLIDQMITRAYSLSANDYPHIKSATFNRDCNLESFWVRGGYDYLYDVKQTKKRYVGKRRLKITGDDPRRLGELAHVFRGSAVFQIRHESPLPQIEWPYHCQNDVPVYPYHPKGGYKRDNAYTSQLAGYETDAGEPCEFSSLLIVDCSKTVDSNLLLWNATPEERQLESSLLSTAVSTAFASLCAQAHALGFTQHNDLLLHEGAVPFVTHVILTNGLLWYFCSYQLNTIDLMNPYIYDNTLCNLAYSSGPHYLCNDLNDLNPANINKNVVNTFLKLLMDKPVKPVDVNGEYVDLSPYLGNKGVKRWAKSFERRESLEEERQQFLQSSDVPTMLGASNDTN